MKGRYSASIGGSLCVCVLSALSLSGCAANQRTEIPGRGTYTDNQHAVNEEMQCLIAGLRWWGARRAEMEESKTVAKEWEFMWSGPDDDGRRTEIKVQISACCDAMGFVYVQVNAEPSEVTESCAAKGEFTISRGYGEYVEPEAKSVIIKYSLRIERQTQHGIWPFREFSGRQGGSARLAVQLNEDGQLEEKFLDTVGEIEVKEGKTELSTGRRGAGRRLGETAALRRCGRFEATVERLSFSTAAVSPGRVWPGGRHGAVEKDR